MSKRIKKFPKKVFINIVHERDPEDDFSVVNEHLQDVDVITNTKMKVAVYKYVDTVEIENVNRLVEN